MATLQRAIEIAVQAHKGAVDKGGFPYILHPMRVMMMGVTEDEQIVGILHDVVEDCEDWTLQRLKDEGFAQGLVMALDNLTRRKEETYADFVERCCTMELSITVKLNDITDNTSISRLDALEEHELGRLKRYHRARKRLLEARKNWNLS